MGILEAQAIGLPCIVTEGTGMTGLVQAYQSGWTCGNSALEIRQVILQALGEKTLLKEKSAGARKMIADHFAWERIAQQTLDTYRDLAAK